MKATFVLIADNDIENYGKRLMLEAHKAGNLGFAAAGIPQHVSLKQPFLIRDLESIEAYFDQFAKEIKPVRIQFEEINIFSSHIFGQESGGLSIRAARTEELDALQKKLFNELNEKFGDCRAEHDDDYIFHMTIAIGGAPYENYRKAYDVLKKRDYRKEAVLDKLGLLYYDSDNLKPGTFFCYKVAVL